VIIPLLLSVSSFGLLFLFFISHQIATVSGPVNWGERQGKSLAAMLFLKKPVVVFQGHGAMDDTMVSFFITALLFYLIKAIFSRPSFFDLIVSGVSVAFEVFTKRILTFHSLPLFALLLIVMLKKSDWKQVFSYQAIGLVLFSQLKVAIGKVTPAPIETLSLQKRTVHSWSVILE
jgi:4-amino-4-deoxy-L-arabinose transferase-like glycosyltransferase